MADVDSEWKLCWLDLETGGFNEKQPILEIFARMTDNNLRPLIARPGWAQAGREFEGVFHQVVYIGGSATIEVGAIDMHTRSGLLAECQHPDNGYYQNHESQVGSRFLSFLQSYGAARQIFLAGSSIHFDRKFIARAWPTVDEFLHYRMLDVSAVMLALNAAQGRAPNFGFPPKADVAHRAQADVEASMRLWRERVTGDIVGSILQRAEL